MGDQDHISQNLYAYVQAFSPAVRDIFERFSFSTQIDRLAKSGLLYLVTERFASIDLHPEKVDNHEMGLAFEELIRKFAELSNETAGEHFTPREVIRLMVNLLSVEDDDVLTKPGVVRTIYDPTAGTGGMLSVAGDHLATLNPQARLSDVSHPKRAGSDRSFSSSPTVFRARAGRSSRQRLDASAIT
jgi:type I restriction enzyme M protein